MLTDLPSNSIPTINITDFFNREIHVSVLRLDMIHPVISGNKWFKLRFYIDEAIAQRKTTVLTFGGAWSNHIIATAAACKLNGLKATGLIRGEAPAALSPTLLQAREWGMELVFISRNDYRQKIIPAGLLRDTSYLIPEGGYGEMGARGAATMLDRVTKKDYTHYCCAVGTGTMMAGLTRAALPGQQIIGVSVLKNNHDLDRNVSVLCAGSRSWQLLHGHHEGGYARHSPALIRFMNEFYGHTGIPSDFVYTGKLFFAIRRLIEDHFFPPGSRLLLIHSGGLQGNVSLPKGTLNF